MNKVEKISPIIMGILGIVKRDDLLTRNYINETNMNIYFYYLNFKKALVDTTDLPSIYSNRNNINRVVKMDLQDISNSTVLLCDMREDQPGKRWGSMAEIAHAHTKNKIIIVWRGKSDDLHPFLEFYATEVHFSLDDCCKAIKDYFN